MFALFYVVMEEARVLQKACLYEAKELRQEVLSNKENSQGFEPVSQ